MTDSGSIRLNLARHGPDATRLLLLHGVTRRWQTFRPILGGLGTQFRVTLLDFRGHGNSERASGRYKVVDYAEDVVHALLAEGGEATIVYGHSLGAMAGMIAAAARPERVRALILEDPPFQTMGVRIEESGLLDYFLELRKHAGSSRTITELSRILARIPARRSPDGGTVRLGDVRDGARLQATAANLARLDGRTLDPVVEGRWLDGFSIRTVASSIRCPVLLLRAGAAGSMLTDDDASEFQRHCSDCTNVKIANAGHAIHEDEPDKLLGVVLSFISAVEPSRLI